MSEWTAIEEEAARQLVRRALEEDLNQLGDITSEALIPLDWQGQGCFIARRAGVISGEAVAEMVLYHFDPQARFQWLFADGSEVGTHEIFGHVWAHLRALLTAERIMLNFLQKLSGIATLTRQYVNAIRGLPCTLLDTRKTAPGWRILEKYAVRCGGGKNHRMGLYDGILIKDNHLAALREHGVDIRQAVSHIRQQFGTRYAVEVEADTLDQVEQALQAGVDIILLDNMSLEMLRNAVALRDKMAPHVLLEASGGITLENVRAVAQTGVNRISVGALTHSAPALDMALEYRASPMS